MNSASIKNYLRHYGSIRSLRGSVIRSTFKRVTAAFDDFDAVQVESAMRELGLDPNNLKCVYCGVEADCWDHLVPASRDGTHQVRNLAPACTACNNIKGYKTWDEFFDTLENSERNDERKQLLRKYVSSLVAGKSLIDDVDQKKLDALLNRIHQTMSEADDVIASAIAKKKLPTAGGT